MAPCLYSDVVGQTRQSPRHRSMGQTREGTHMAQQGQRAHESTQHSSVGMQGHTHGSRVSTWRGSVGAGTRGQRAFGLTIKAPALHAEVLRAGSQLHWVPATHVGDLD